jgi:NitT/TauT family transport system substrate-binding protein
MKVVGRALAAAITLALLVGCVVGASAQKSRVVRVGYWGGTCEAPIYIAYEKGIFKRNGLNVELMQLNPAVFKEALASGKLDCYQTTPSDFKAIEQGLDIVIVDGVHNGCIEAVVPKGSPIKSVRDLKGKTIGTDMIGGAPMAFLGMDLLRQHINPNTEVTWKIYPPPQLALAMEKKEVDAFITWDPFPAMAVRDGQARVFFSNTYTKPYNDTFCCYVAVNGALARKEPQIARALAKSFSEAGDWIAKNPKRAAQISIDMKYTAGDADLNGQLLASYPWIHGNEKRVKGSYTLILTQMKKLGMLESTTDINAFVKKTFVYMGSK